MALINEIYQDRTNEAERKYFQSLGKIVDIAFVPSSFIRHAHRVFERLSGEVQPRERSDASWGSSPGALIAAGSLETLRILAYWNGLVYLFSN